MLGLKVWAFNDSFNLKDFKINMTLQYDITMFISPVIKDLIIQMLIKEIT